MMGGRAVIGLPQHIIFYHLHNKKFSGCHSNRCYGNRCVVAGMNLMEVIANTPSMTLPQRPPDAAIRSARLRSCGPAVILLAHINNKCWLLSNRCHGNVCRGSVTAEY